MEQQVPGAQGLPRAGVSVFTCYNQLRHEIQALLAENWELSQVVKGLREQCQQQPAATPAPASAPAAVPITLRNPNPEAGLFQFPSIVGGMEGELAPLEQNPPAHSTPCDSQAVSMPSVGSDITGGTMSSGTGHTNAPVEALNNPPASGSRLPPEPSSMMPSLRLLELWGLGSGAAPYTGTPQDRQGASNANSQLASQNDTHKVLWEQLVGEVAFQLDRRILARVFPNCAHLYGFTVTNIPQKIVEMAMGTEPGVFNEQVCARAAQRYGAVMARLRPLGYNPTLHPAFTELMVNHYGILPRGAHHSTHQNVPLLRHIVAQTVPVAMRHDAIVLMECLEALARDDGRPLFIW